MNAIVNLNFEHAGVEYNIRRSVTGRFDGKQYLQSHSTQAQLDITYSNKETETLDDNLVIESRISSIMRKDIREFFFFDAESLELLNNLDKPKQSSKIEEGILQLLQVKDLKQAVESADRLQRKITRSIANDSKDGEKNKYVKEFEKIDLEIKQCDQIIKQCKEDITNAQIERESREEYYQSTKETRKITEKIQALEKEKRQLKQTIDAQINSMSKLILDGSNQLFFELLPQMKDKVSIFRRNSNDNVPKSVIEQTLSQNICYLCGNNLSEHPEAEAHVQELLAAFQNSQSSAYLSQIEAGINEVENNREYFIKQQAEEFKNYSENFKKKNALQFDIDNLKDQLGANDQEIEESHKVGESVRDIEANINMRKGQIKSEQGRKENLLAKREEISVKLTEIMDTDKKNSFKLKETNLLKQMSESLNQIIKEYGQKSRKKIQKYTLEFYNQLISKQDKHVISKVAIGERFDFKIFDEQEKNITADISKGH